MQNYTGLTERNNVLKRQCHKIFCFRFFSWIIIPQAPENNTRVISNFFRKFAEIFASQGAPPVSTKWWQICHRCQQHREKIYLYANSTTQSCPKEIMKTFLIEDFLHLPPGVNNTGGAPWAANISPNFQNWNGPNGIIRGLGKTYHVENLKLKISWRCPFNIFVGKDPIFCLFPWLFFFNFDIPDLVCWTPKCSSTDRSWFFAGLVQNW